MLLDKERDILGSLDVGQAVVKLQGRIARPFQITIPLFEIEKGKITDTFIKKHMQDIAPTIHEEDFRLPAERETATAPNLNYKSENGDVLAFLWDIKQFPGSGIAQRYKRLGISVRQGQKIKDRILRDELIMEHIEAIRTGRIKIIKLTEKGLSFLSKSK